MKETLKEKINSLKNKQKKIAKKAALTTAIAAGMFFSTDKVSAQSQNDSLPHNDTIENISNKPVKNLTVRTQGTEVIYSRNKITERDFVIDKNGLQFTSNEKMYPLEREYDSNNHFIRTSMIDTQGEKRLLRAVYNAKQKAEFSYDKKGGIHSENLTGITYTNGSEEKYINLQKNVENSNQNGAVEGYARLAKTNLNDLTPENIDEKVVESYIFSLDKPQKGTYFYKLYQQTLTNRGIVKLKINER